MSEKAVEDPQEFEREYILDAIRVDIPLKFWRDLLARTRQTYSASYELVKNDSSLIEEQKLTYLGQKRHFDMEGLLQKVATACDFVASPKPIKANSCYYVYASRGRLGLTQSYEQQMASPKDSMKPARFREQLAGMNHLSTAVPFDFGDEPMQIYELKDFYGVLVHSPAGRKFTDREQMLGMMQLGIPHQDGASWALLMPIVEIAASYGESSDEHDEEDIPWKAVPGAKNASNL